MKKLLVIIAAIVLAGVDLFGQEVKCAEHWVNGSCFCGLKNIRTGKWVVQPIYKSANYHGSYEGVHYYSLKNTDNLWGFITSEDFTRMKVSHRYEDVQYGFIGGFPMIGVKKGSDWGVVELYTSSCRMIYPTVYKAIVGHTAGDGILLYPWEGNSVHASRTTLKNRFDNCVKREQEAAEKKKKAAEVAKQKETERVAREKKEAELASFTKYAKNYVTPLINDWQKKDEFEKLADYQVRVTGESRLAKIAEFTQEAEKLFIQEHEKLDHLKTMTLEEYDSENELFSIRSPKFGQLLLPVPIAEGRSFKENFSTVIKSEPEYFIQNDALALRSLVFINSATGKSYKYNNVAGLHYSTYEINADSFEFEGVRISSTTTSTVTSTVKPKCMILSPRTGESYSEGHVNIRYRVSVGEGLSYKIKVSVNGEDVLPTMLPEVTTKGVKLSTGEEMVIKVPRKTGEACNIRMWVEDSEGTLGEPQKLVLSYIGERPKPRLHLFAVGVGDYPAKDLNDLSYASKDAKDFINTITTSNTEIYSEVSSAVLVDKAATRNGVLGGLKALVSNVDQGDVVMVYFSGHAVKEGEQCYYMTHDASAAECFRGVDFMTIRSQLKSLIEEMKCHVVLFMDTCYSGTMFGLKGGTQEFSMTIPGLVGFYSSTPGQQSAELDNLENGAFTHALLQGLKGAAKNEDGEITLNVLESYVKSAVKKVLGDKQAPLVENMLGDAVLFKVK